MSEAPGRCIVKNCEASGTTEIRARVEVPFIGSDFGAGNSWWFNFVIRVCSMHWQDWPTRTLEVRLQP